MSSRIRFFREWEGAQSTHEFLNRHKIKSFIRERTPGTVQNNEVPYGFDIFILRDEDLAEAWKLLDYEYGKSFGDTGTIDASA